MVRSVPTTLPTDETVGVFGWEPVHRCGSHVRIEHRESRAGVRMDFGDADPDHLPDVIADTIAAPVTYRSVETGGAARAAAAIAELV